MHGLARGAVENVGDNDHGSMRIQECRPGRVDERQLPEQMVQRALKRLSCIKEVERHA